MHRSVMLIAGAAAAVLLVAATATATTQRTTSAKGAESAAAPFSQAWANVPRTTAGREAANVVVFGAEQDIDGFNTSLACCNELWANYMGGIEAVRGAFIQNNKGVWTKDLVSSASADKSGVTYTIKSNANWYWGGKKVPVTYKDFLYTLQQIDSKANFASLTGTTGYGNLDPSHFTHKGLKTVKFFWRTKGCSDNYPCGAYANWQSLFSGVYPSTALAGQDFTKIWTNCICGNNGQPVSDGPYYVSNYTKGQGTTLKANPFFYGSKPKIGEIDFKLYTDTNTEVQAMRGGEVDAITPTFGQNLTALKGVSGITFNQIPGYYYEHLEFNETKSSSNPLLRSPWMREAIALGINRAGIINTVYGSLAGNTKPMDNAIFYSTEAPYKADFSKWNYNPTKALAILKAHCSGGPSSVGGGGTWTCSGFPAKFRWTWTAGNVTRQNTEAIVKSELHDIGIDLTEDSLPANVVFGPNGIPGKNYDIAEFAEITSGDPGDWYDLYRCAGGSNYTGYCSNKVTDLMKKGNAELNPTQRIKDFQAADTIMATSVPVFPMYQRPTPLIYKSNLLGMVNNPTTFGPFWNIEGWHWKS